MVGSRLGEPASCADAGVELPRPIGSEPSAASRSPTVWSSQAVARSVAPRQTVARDTRTHRSVGRRCGSSRVAARPRSPTIDAARASWNHDAGQLRSCSWSSAASSNAASMPRASSMRPSSASRNVSANSYRRDVGMRCRVVTSGLLHLAEASLLAAKEEEQERQVEERESRERGRTQLVGATRPVPRPVRGALRAGRASPTTAPATTGTRECAAVRRSGGTRGSRHPSRRCRRPRADRRRGRGGRSAAPPPILPNAPIRAVGPTRRELLVEWHLADDERVVKDRGRHAQRADVIETTSTIERCGRVSSCPTTARRRSTARRPAGPRVAR